MRTVIIAAVLLLAGCASSAPSSPNVSYKDQCEQIAATPDLHASSWKKMVQDDARQRGENEAIAWTRYVNYIRLNCPNLLPAVGG